MFIDVEAFLFNSPVNAQAMQALDTIEKRETAGGSPEVDNEDAEALGTEESPSVTIESAVGGRKQPSHQGAEDTAYTVYRRCTYWVVDMQRVVDKLNCIDEHQTTDQSYDDGSKG